MQADVRQKLQELLGGRVRFDASLKPLTSMRVGGPAAALAYPNTRDEVVTVLELCTKLAVPTRVIGGGTNLIVPDEGYPGVVVTTTQLQDYKIEPADGDAVLLCSDAGVRIARLIYVCLEEALTGLEFAAGIPGTFGGVLWMNAGTKGGSVQQVFHDMEIIEPHGARRTLNTTQVNFTYRNSHLPHGSVILGGSVRLRRGDKAQIQAAVTKVKSYRLNQPIDWPNSGSIFKNPPGDHAGRLIEASGLKGKRLGGAMISDKHANFIINVDDAKAADVLGLIQVAQEVVLKQHGVKLETEVEVLR